MRDGHIEVAEVPMPELRPEGVLVDVRASLLSAGTERTKVLTGRQSLIGKARSRPDQVRKVMDKARKDGLRETIDAVRIRLDQPGGLGYSCAGVVLAAGARVRDLRPGDRVACGGADYAVHAEVDYVPGNLCVRLPDAVSFEHAAFTTVGSIAMHGVRQADARLGERVAVIGLGLVGQLAGQILRAAGCTVVGVDLDAQLVERALENGAADRTFVRGALDDPGALAQVGACDAILITAATKSADPVELAAALARDRARVVIVGDVALDLDRAHWYEKELDLRLSRSYGPGRYDVEYEERGLDYPVGYVRWTERRNMQAFVELLASQRIDVAPLIAETLDIGEAPRAYERLADSAASTLGVVLRYEETAPAAVPNRDESPNGAVPRRTGVQVDTPAENIGVIGAGSFAQRILIPSLRDAGFKLSAVASATGVTAAAARDRFKFDRACGVDELIEDPAIGLVVIATRHATHAELAERALLAGKHVFVEKPPAITIEQLESLREAREASGRTLTVGFNRRHAPLAQRMREHFANRTEPMELLYRINAGKLESGHWLNDLDDGGGRLIGEGSHFIDFACWMARDLADHVTCTLLPEPGGSLAAAQRFSVAMSFPDGSLATVIYGVGGADRVGKEYVEAHAGGRTAVLDDFRHVRLYEGAGACVTASGKPDKGHDMQCDALMRYLRHGAHADTSPAPLDTMSISLMAHSATRTCGRLT